MSKTYLFQFYLILFNQILLFLMETIFLSRCVSVWQINCHLGYKRLVKCAKRLHFPEGDLSVMFTLHVKIKRSDLC